MLRTNGTYRLLRKVNAALELNPSDYMLITIKNGLIQKLIEAHKQEVSALKETKGRLWDDGVDIFSPEWIEVVCDIANAEARLERYLRERVDVNELGE